MPADRQTFRVLGTPYPWRTARWGRGMSYKMPQLARWQDDVAVQVAAARPTKMAGPLRFETSVWVPRPKTHLLKSGKLCKGAPLLPTSKATGDATNHHKAIEDALKGLVWTDDAQVVDFRSALRYADDVEPGAELTVERVAG